MRVQRALVVAAAASTIARAEVAAENIGHERT
jgi:hypothetical protein